MCSASIQTSRSASGSLRPMARWPGTRQTLNIGPQGGVNGIPFQTCGLSCWVGIRWSSRASVQAIRRLSTSRCLGATPQAPAPAPAPGNIPSFAERERVAEQWRTRHHVSGRLELASSPASLVGVYITAPDQSVYGAPFQVKADSQGNAGPVTFSTNSQVPTGVYAMSFEGVESHNKAIGYFAVTP